MKIESLHPMVVGVSNKNFLFNLGSNSELWLLKSEGFYKVFGFRDSKVISFYGTKLSPTATAVSHFKRIKSIWSRRFKTQLQNAMGKYTMEGPKACLVDRTCATHGRPWEHNLNFVIGLKKDPSKLVKFSVRDICYDEHCQIVAEFTSEASKVIQSRIAPAKDEQKYDQGKLQFLLLAVNVPVSTSHCFRYLLRSLLVGNKDWPSQYSCIIQIVEL